MNNKLDEITHDIERLRNDRLKKIELLKQLEEKQRKREQSRLRIEQEISQIEQKVHRSSEDLEQKAPKTWVTDIYGNVLNFCMTEARKDILFRLKTNQLYTTEEVKILIKEIVKKMKQNAEVDINNLIFLSDYRNKLLYPQVSMFT